jgi:hypothetical protein
MIFFATVLILAVSSSYSVFAQNNIEDVMNEEYSIEKANDLDNILNPTISATLTGLSLTGGTFLVNLTRNTTEDVAAKIHLARKSFIKAFFMFLICTISLFVFDFIQILSGKYIIFYTLLDVIITYLLFGIGALYLVNAARHLYRTYGK